jgi:hypothetical protein
VKVFTNPIGLRTLCFGPVYIFHCQVQLLLKAIGPAASLPRFPCTNPSTPPSFSLRRSRFICRGEIRNSFARQPPFAAVPLSASPHGFAEVPSDSRSTPTRSSDLLRFWGEDLTPEGDRIAKQFWGDIFAKLLHGKPYLLTVAWNVIKGPKGPTTSDSA